jgi:hypothetical protein
MKIYTVKIYTVNVYQLLCITFLLTHSSLVVVDGLLLAVPCPAAHGSAALCTWAVPFDLYFGVDTNGKKVACSDQS